MMTAFNTIDAFKYGLELKARKFRPQTDATRAPYILCFFLNTHHIIDQGAYSTSLIVLQEY